MTNPKSAVRQYSQQDPTDTTHKGQQPSNNYSTVNKLLETYY